MYWIRKNLHSVQNPWLGKIPESSEDVFGKITDLMVRGGRPRTFRTAGDAFEFIRRYYPGDYGVMLVFEVIESRHVLQFHLVATPER